MEAKHGSSLQFLGIRDRIGLAWANNEFLFQKREGRGKKCFIRYLQGASNVTMYRQLPSWKQRIFTMVCVCPCATEPYCLAERKLALILPWTMVLPMQTPASHSSLLFLPTYFHIQSGHHHQYEPPTSHLGKCGHFPSMPPLLSLKEVH